MNKIHTWLAVLSLFFIVMLFAANTGHIIDSSIDNRVSKTFSNTQEWEQKYLDLASTTPSLLPDFTNKLFLPPPPTNTSTTTEAELTYLKSLESNRTPDNLTRINRDLLLQNAQFGEHSYEALLNLTIRPVSAKLISDILTNFGPVVMYYKRQYDRVRPSYLDPSLMTTIEIPRHAAYPSGHAAQSMLIALILSELDPANAEAYEESARSIAYYREVAGVHYPSDSVAGQLLAEQYYSVIKKTTMYQTFIPEAKAEWPN